MIHTVKGFSIVNEADFLGIPLLFLWSTFYTSLLFLTINMGSPHNSVDKESIHSAGDCSLIPGSGRSTGEGIRYLLQYPWASVTAHLVKNSPAMWEIWVQSLDWEDPLEKGKATHTPVFWPGEFQGLYSPWCCKELDTTEWISLSL